MQEQDVRRQVTTAVENFVKQLLIAFKAVMLYPPASGIPHENAEIVVGTVHELFEMDPELRLAVGKDRFRYGDTDIFPEHAAFEPLAQAFYHRGVIEMRFHPGVTAEEFVSMLGLLRLTPVDIVAAGGFEAQLWDADVASITVTESRVQIVGEISGESSERPATAADVQRMLDMHASGRTLDYLVITRVVSDSTAMREFLESHIDSANRLDASWVRDLAHLAAAQPVRERPGLVRALADAIDLLDPHVKRALIADQLLPQARHDDALAAVIRQMDVDAVCRMLVQELGGGEASREGVARALRNLALISMADRSEVLNAAGAAMRGAGADEETVGAVLDLANPSVLTVRGGEKTSGTDEHPVDSILKLLDIAPRTASECEADADVAVLQVEARCGITDADVLHALVTLVTINPGSERWAAVMAMLESSLELIVPRGEFGIAADAAQLMVDAGTDERFSVVQRRRLSSSVELLAREQHVQALANALRVYDEDTPEYRSARRLLDLLGAHAISSLLAVLAKEGDRATRKALVDLLGGLAPSHIAEVGKHVLDSRWFFVRNVVTVLGTTRSPAAVPYLTRAARHPDVRVRRETIRALSGIADRTASQLLVAMLSDDDAQNVQLAARYLGQSRVAGAVPVLMQLARGEGRGNREMAARLEAIEALGQIGSEDALAVLSALARKRSLGVTRDREVRSAAEAAAARIAMAGATV